MCKTVYPNLHPSVIHQKNRAFTKGYRTRSTSHCIPINPLRNTRWRSGGLVITCDNGEKVRVAFAIDYCDGEAGEK